MSDINEKPKSKSRDLPNASADGLEINFSHNHADYLDGSEKDIKPVANYEKAEKNTVGAVLPDSGSKMTKPSTGFAKKKAEKNDKAEKKQRVRPEKKALREDPQQNPYGRIVALGLWKTVWITMLIPPIIIFFMPLLGFHGSPAKIGFTYALVVLFWLSAVFSYAGLLVVKLKNKMVVAKMYKGKPDAFKIYRFFGIANFFRNQYAFIADIVLIVLTIVFAILAVLAISVDFRISNTIVMSIILGIYILSLNMHVYFNDSIFEYLIKTKKSIVKRSVNANE